MLVLVFKKASRGVPPITNPSLRTPPSSNFAPSSSDFIFSNKPTGPVSFQSRKLLSNDLSPFLSLFQKTRTNAKLYSQQYDKTAPNRSFEFISRYFTSNIPQQHIVKSFFFFQNFRLFQILVSVSDPFTFKSS